MRTIPFVFVALTMAFASASWAESLRCSFTARDGAGAVPPELVFDIPQDGRVATTRAPGGPAREARIVARDAVKTVLRWGGPGAGPAGASARDRAERAVKEPGFQATVLRGKNRVMLKVTPKDARRSLTGLGTCKPAGRP